MIVASAVADWIEQGRTDVHLWALRGLGIDLHEEQVRVVIAEENEDAQYYLLWWANRAGKTTGVFVAHAHRLFYKIGVPRPTTQAEYDDWVKIEYRTLHTAPLNVLAGRAHSAWGEIVKGVSPAQRDPATGSFRPAPLAPFFSCTRERTDDGSDRLFMRCLTGGVTDFFSTEGQARRLEAVSWRFISWDEWTQQENIDDIRTVLFVRLTNRAADFDAPILLTGTITDETEHIAKEWIVYCEDPDNLDWWGSTAARTMNPGASAKAIERALRNLDPEDYARAVLGVPGGAKGRLIPPLILDPVFANDLPRFTPPLPGDGALLDAGTARYRPRADGEWTYLHLWDLALAAAENVGTVLRVPANWQFSHDNPIVGVSMKVIPGSRTLTSAEIIHTIEETYLPYGGLIVVDTTDAHGKNIHRELRRAGYPVADFTYNERDARKILRKDAAIESTRKVMTDGATFLRDAKGEIQFDVTGVPIIDPGHPFGALKLPPSWTKHRDQLSILRVDDERQRKDAAMTVLMGCDEAYRRRRSRTRQTSSTRFAVFAGGRRMEARR